MKPKLTEYRELALPLGLSIAALVAALSVFNRFLNFVEARPGIQIPDPLLSFISPRDVTWLTFAVIYVSLAAAILILLKNPRRLLLGIQAYTLLTLFRLVAMYLVPLDAPEGIIVLRDPVVEFFGSSRVLTKDLFFSGHTSLVFLLGCVMEKRSLRVFYFLATLVVGALVLVQHVHYSIDVLAAPFFSFAAYCGAEALRALREGESKRLSPILS